MKKSFALLIPIIAALTFIPALVDANNAGDFSGGVAIGTGYAGIDTAPTNGIIVQGNTGIGATTPGNKLDVQGGSGVSDGTVNGLAVYSTNTTYTTKGRVGSNYDAVYITQNAYYNGSAWVADNTSRAVSAIVLNAYNGNGFIQFQTTSTNNNGIGSQAMEIDSSGNVDIGTGTARGGAKLDVNGKVYVATFAANSSTTVCQNSNVLSTCTSARRYKEKIVPSELGLKEVLKMKPVTFDLKDHKDNWEKHDFGFVAEDMAKINPLFVTYDEGGEISGVRYMQLTAVNAKAIQELNGVIEKQQDEIDELKRKIERLTHEK